MAIHLVGALALIVGAAAFLVFWESSVFWDDQLLGLDVAWMIRLAVHGVSILLMPLGLILRYWTGSASGQLSATERIAVATAVAGLLTVLPLFFAGIALLGVAALVSGRPSPVGLVLVLGATLYAVTYGTGVRLGFEDGPPLSDTDKVLAASSIALVASGLVAIGLGSLQTRGREANGVFV